MHGPVTIAGCIYHKPADIRGGMARAKANITCPGPGVHAGAMGRAVAQKAQEDVHTYDYKGV